MVFVGSVVCVCPLRVRRKVADIMPMAQPFPPGQVVGSGLLSVHNHGTFLPLYTEIFLGHAVSCMAYLAITQIKRIYVLDTHSQS